ncbi:helix-turn-helix transcriptional regulator [[Clostridium] innocuum]|uniref:helix-turn-helix domain-containing protein n=1 Tax=Bacillota TaxID=1239 RepID=UPI0009F4BAC7|nr:MULTISPECIES: helix-turn-helix transcriptional regulator [Thomasclavelia]MBS7022070.1 helix-turn-helix transcriptional regulator [Haemophilus parainfluenzae]MBV4343156.1 helix-turn-helix transcriptional regulator [Erysipelatoclostridium sp. DFI.2.3]MCC2792873.1 helix-turn-helix transcriptional regulator [[Clostridium] innocuum]MCC2800932.1 helix-turn-helix transcriptional regulator [[Clostridium] innocuum]MCC2807082.1 helix-turn-helix transcriptional regulator [[Clostridium] innocuum]
MKLLIYERRIEKEKTLRDLSKLTGITKSTLNNYENGKTSPTIHQLEKIAEALHIKITDLFESDFK